MAEYKTEKRPAKVGERILITDAFDGEPCYQNGDIGVVSGVYEDDVVVAEINGRKTGMIHREYEVIVEESEEVTQ